MNNKRILYKCTLWCELPLPDNQDMNEVIQAADHYKDEKNCAELIFNSINQEMRWLYLMDSEEPMSVEENNGLSTVQIYDKDKLIFENNDKE